MSALEIVRFASYGNHIIGYCRFKKANQASGTLIETQVNDSAILHQCLFVCVWGFPVKLLLSDHVNTESAVLSQLMSSFDGCYQVEIETT